MDRGLIHPAIVYGTVKSKRIPGLSLGLNILPEAYKMCSFNCIYCERGLTEVFTTGLTGEKDLPSPGDFERVLEKAIRDSARVDALTFSGNGEPTLNPGFGEFVDIAIRLRDKHIPKAKVGILSNSSTIGNNKVLRGLNKLDYRMMKLDAGNTGTFHRINRPHRALELEKIVAGLKALDKIAIQTMFTGGSIRNTGEQDLQAWTECIAEISPDNVHIYSIHRPPAEPSVTEVPEDKLEQIAAFVISKTGVPAEAIVRDAPYHDRKRSYWK